MEEDGKCKRGIITLLGLVGTLMLELVDLSPWGDSVLAGVLGNIPKSLLTHLCFSLVRFLFFTISYHASCFVLLGIKRNFLHESFIHVEKS